MHPYSRPVALCAVGLAAVAAADTFTDDFEQGVNIGKWNIGGNYNIDAAGGNNEPRKRQFVIGVEGIHAGPQHLAAEVDEAGGARCSGRSGGPGR